MSPPLSLKNMNINFSTFLTLFRLIFSPLALPFLIVWAGLLQSFYINTAVAVIFLLLSFTDFLDGFLARRYEQVTQLGAMLDPIADKFLSYAALVALVAAHKLFFYWAILLIGREFFIMSLRMSALQHGFSIAVGLIGKLKTVAITFFIAWVILNPHQDIYFSRFVWDLIEYLLLAVSMFLSIGSAFEYTKEFISHYSRTTKS